MTANTTKSKPTSNPISFSLTVVTSTTGIVTKQLSLGADGSIIKTPAATLYSGSAERRTVTLEGLAELLRALNSNQCLVHGVCGHDLAHVVTASNFTPGQTRGDVPVVARTAKCFTYESGKPALMMLDVDAVPGKPTIKAAEVLSILEGFCPGIAAAGIVVTPSTSSCIWLEDIELKGETGLHIYLVAKDGADIPRFGKVLFRRLWLAGHGHIHIDKAGRMLMRTIIDGAVFRAERIDFASGAVCADGLEQRLPPPLFTEGGWLDTALTVDVSEDELAIGKQMVTAAKELSAPAAALVRAEYVEIHAAGLVEKSTGRVTLEAARSAIESRLSGELMLDDWLFFDTLGAVQVSAVLANMARFDGQTLSDPVDTDRGPGKGMFYANVGHGVPVIHSFIHGGLNYKFAKRKVWNCAEARAAVHALATEVKEAAAEDGSPEEAEFNERIKALYKDLFQSNDFDEADLDEMRTLCKKKLKCNKETLDNITKGASTGEGSKAKLPPQSSVADTLLGGFKNVWFYAANLGRWYKYNGTGLWEASGAGDFLSVVKKRLSAHPEVVGLGYSESYLNGVEGLLTVDLRGDMATPPHHLIPFRNGVLDALTGAMIPHSAANNLTWQLEFDYVEGAICPFCQQWLLQRLGTESRVNLVRAIIGAILLGMADLQFFVELYGTAGAGKSVFQWLLEQIVGAKNIGTTDLTRLEKERFEAAGLVGKRMIVISDSKSWAGEVPVLKAMTGNDLVTIERKHQQQDGEGVRIGGIVVVAANQPIQVTDLSNAISRRRVSVPWLKAVPEREIRTDIKADLGAELAGIVRWALGLGESDTRSIIKGSKGDKRSADALGVLIATNPIAAWLDDNTVFRPQHRTNIGTANNYEKASTWLYSNYEKYLSDDSRNSRPLGVKKFGEALHVMLTETLKLKACFRCEKNTHGRQFEGLELRGGLMDNRPSPLQVAREMANA